MNFHRPCGVPEQLVDAKGKVKTVYRRYATPWEILQQLPGLAGHLKEAITVQQLERQAQASTDSDSAQQMQEAKRNLFSRIHPRKTA